MVEPSTSRASLLILDREGCFFFFGKGSHRFPSRRSSSLLRCRLHLATNFSFDERRERRSLKIRFVHSQLAKELADLINSSSSTITNTIKERSSSAVETFINITSCQRCCSGPAMVGDIPQSAANNIAKDGRQRTFEVVVAATKKMGIGKDGKLPWKLPSELKFFKQLTMTTSGPTKKNAVIMGRKTWESIPIFKRPLPGRLNIVLTRSGSFDIANVENLVICSSMSTALNLLANSPYCLSTEKVFVIGGGQILRDALNSPWCDAIHLTDIDASIECDTFIPPIDFSVFWPRCSSVPFVENNIRYSFVTYVRVKSQSSESQTQNCEQATTEDLLGQD